MAKSRARKRYLKNVKTSRKAGAGGAVQTNASGNLKLVLVTCDQGRERQCRDEVVDIFTEIADERFPEPKESPEEATAADEAADPSTSSSSSAASAMSIADELAAEFSEMKDASSSSGRSGSASQRFSWIAGPNGIVLIHIKSKVIEPVKLVSAVFEEALRRDMPLTRHSIRMIPFTRTCYSDQDTIIELAKSIVTEAFKDIPEENSYATKIKRRANNKIDRDKVIRAIATMVGRRKTSLKEPDVVVGRRKTSLKEPDVVVIVESFGNASGVSVVSNPGDFLRFRAFNLRAVYENRKLKTGSNKKGTKRKRPEAEKKPESSNPVTVETSATESESISNVPSSEHTSAMRDADEPEKPETLPDEKEESTSNESDEPKQKIQKVE